LGDQNVFGEVILERIIQKGCEVGSVGSVWCPVMGFCEHGDEPFLFHKNRVSFSPAE